MLTNSLRGKKIQTQPEQKTTTTKTHVPLQKFEV